MSRKVLDGRVATRKRNTDKRLKEFATALSRHLAGDLRALVGDHTCVYTVGSAGRGELTTESDLDLFLVRHREPVSNLDAVILQAAIVQASRRARFPDPSNDGDWLTMHSADKLFELLGNPEDDTANTFTARMLLILESRPILGDAAYGRIVEKVVDRYWRDAEYHPMDYQPILLVNDIVRYWRTLLLNYEARIHRRREDLTTDQWEVYRKVRSYKVGFSRCLTCYSALAYLLAVTRMASQPHVSRDDVQTMVALSPLDRLLWVGERVADVDGIRGLVDKMVIGYLDFLEVADRGKGQLLEDFRRARFASERSREKRAFGDAMFELVSRLGDRNPLMRWLVV